MKNPLSYIGLALGLMFLAIPLAFVFTLWDTFPDRTFLIVNASIVSSLMIAIIVKMIYGIEHGVPK